MDASFTSFFMIVQDACAHHVIQEVDDGRSADGPATIQLIVHMLPNHTGSSSLPILLDYSYGLLLIVFEDLAKAISLRVKYQCQITDSPNSMNLRRLLYMHYSLKYC